MGSLIKFELKKIFSRRVTQVSCVLILLLFIVQMGFNITSQYALDPNEVGTEFAGTEAIVQIKANADALAGPITDEIATEKLREYQQFISPEGEIKDEFSYNGGVFGERADELWRFNSANNAYMGLLTEPWRLGYSMPVTVAATIDTSHTVDLYGQIQNKVADELEANQYGFTFTEAEKEFWLSKAQNVVTPVEYGYAGGWEDFLNMAQFLIFAIIAIVIACAPVFNGEYSARTDAIILSTRYGKTRLGKVKALAAFIAASMIYWVEALVLLLIPLVFFGAEGAHLPIQAMTLSNTYSISIGAAAFICCLVGYLAALALTGIVLALSARIRSAMAILAIGAAIIFVPMFLPNLGNSIAEHIVYLFPYYSLNAHNLFDTISFAMGSVVVEYPVFCLILYAILFIVGSLFAMHAFKRHQVA